MFSAMLTDAFQDGDKVLDEFLFADDMAKDASTE